VRALVYRQAVSAKGPKPPKPAKGAAARSPKKATRGATSAKPGQLELPTVDPGAPSPAKVERPAIDPLARAFYELKFENAYLRLKGEAFQDFFAAVMEKKYPADFVRVRPWGNSGDRKNDGYLRSRRILFQCYAPNEMTAALSLKKIKADFVGALPYWKTHFDTWVFLHNSERGLSPEITEVLLDLRAKHAPLVVTSWGFEELRQEAMALAEPELSSLFGPALTRSTMISLGLEELAPVLDHISKLTAVVVPDLRPVPPDKLETNMLSGDVQTLLIAGMSRADLVRKFFRLKQTLRDEIAESFRGRYAELRASHTPDAIFAELQRLAGGDVVRDPGAQAAILAVLAFFFEECDIFERPEPPETAT
jgi:hypothetical protein